VDPNLLNPDRDADPDSAFQVNPDTDPNLIRIQGFEDQKMEKKIKQKIF
jgi:hypothetical protein